MRTAIEEAWVLEAKDAFERTADLWLAVEKSTPLALPRIGRRIVMFHNGYPVPVTELLAMFEACPDALPGKLRQKRGLYIDFGRFASYAEAAQAMRVSMEGLAAKLAGFLASVELPFGALRH